MGKSSVSAKLLSGGAYVTDRGTNVPGFSFQWKPPFDFTVAQEDTILAAVGAERKTDADRSLCPVSAGDFRPRRIKFVRASGNSFSLPILDLADLVSTGQAIKAVIDATTDPLACAALIGETWRDLIQELRPTSGFTPGVGAPSAPATGGKQPFHSGKILYEADGTSGPIAISIKVATDTAGQAPTRLAAAWAGCVGAFEPRIPCSSSSSWKHRRYILTSKVGTTAYETAEIPIKERAAASINDCGEALAALNHGICLAYKGESNGRFHLLLT